MFEAARRSRACAYLADDDHGPLALQEILLAGCPTVGVRTGASNASSSRARRPVLSAHLLFAVLSSVVLALLGLAVSALSMLPSDAPGFFLLTGLHLIACGMLGVIRLLGKPRWPVHHLFCWTSMLLNAALAVRIGMLGFDGTIRGPLIIAAPLLIGVPAAINVVAAVMSLRRVDQTNT